MQTAPRTSSSHGGEITQSEERKMGNDMQQRSSSSHEMWDLGGLRCNPLEPRGPRGGPKPPEEKQQGEAAVKLGEGFGLVKT